MIRSSKVILLISLLIISVVLTACSKLDSSNRTNASSGNKKKTGDNIVKDVQTVDLDFRPSHMAIDPEDKIWLSGFILDSSAQLVRYDPLTKKTKSFKIDTEPNTGFFSSLKSDANSVWVGFGNNIVKFNIKNEASEIIGLPAAKYPVSDDKFEYDNLNSKLAKDFSLIDMQVVNDDLWISRRYSNSITKYSITDGKFIEYKLPDEFGVPEYLFPDTFGNIWMTVSLSGDNSGIKETRVSNDRVGKYNISNGNFEYFNQPAGILAIDQQGSAWLPFLANNTLVNIDKSGSTKKSDFKFNMASSDKMIADKDGNLIFTAQSKLRIIDKDTKTILSTFKLPIRIVQDHGSRLPPDDGQPPKKVDTELGSEYKDILFDTKGNLWLLNENYNQLVFINNSDI